MNLSRLRQLSVFTSLACASLFFGANAHGQEFDLGVKGGVTVPELRGGHTELDQKMTSIIGPIFGITGSMEYASGWGAQLELLYAGEGGKRTGTQPLDKSDFVSFYPALPPAMVASLPLPSTLYASFVNRARLNYLEIPLLLKYSHPLGAKFKIFADVGPFAAFLLDAKTKTSGTSNIYVDKNLQTPITQNMLDPSAAATPVSHIFTETINITDQIRDFNAGITGGVGLEYYVGPGAVTFEVRGVYGLTDVSVNVARDGKNHTGNLNFTLGYVIKIK